jgi:hypothetical protein
MLRCSHGAARCHHSLKFLPSSFLFHPFVNLGNFALIAGFNRAGQHEAH